jgi:hypothetical protein
LVTTLFALHLLHVTMLSSDSVSSSVNLPNARSRVVIDLSAMSRLRSMYLSRVREVLRQVWQVTELSSNPSKRDDSRAF